jgi:hypothetical protein
MSPDAPEVSYKQPVSVLVIVHTTQLHVLLLERAPVGRMRLAVMRRMRKANRATRLADPVAILEHVGERVEVVAEVFGKLEPFREGREQRRLVLDVREVDVDVADCRVAGGRLDSIGVSMVVEHARLVVVGEIRQLHSRILRNVA